jgi:hypothetical protein
MRLSQRRPRIPHTQRLIVRLNQSRPHRQRPPFVASSCRKLVPARFTRLRWSRPALHLLPRPQLRGRESSAVSRSSIAVRREHLADSAVHVRAAPVRTPAARAPSIPRVPGLVVSPDQAVPEHLAAVQVSPVSGPASARGLAGLAVRALVDLAALVAQLRRPLKRRVHSAQARPEAVVGASSTPRPKKAR